MIENPQESSRHYTNCHDRLPLAAPGAFAPRGLCRFCSRFFELHDASPCRGEWIATGTSFGKPRRLSDDPRSNSEPWNSTLTATWYSGQFFLIQDERATSRGAPFDTISILGVDARTGKYFARSFENHGFYRHYDVTLQGRVWTLTGDTERARIELSTDGRAQTITWEWKPDDHWLPLCDRVAIRQD